MNRTIKNISLLLLFLCGSVAASADNAITLSSVSGASGKEVTISVSMTNTDAVTNLQLSIPLDESLSFVEGSVAKKNRLKNHSVSAGVKEGVLNLVIYSTSMSAINGNSGELCSFKLLLADMPGSVSLSPSKTSLTGSDGKSLTASVSAGTVDIRGAKAKISQSTLDFGRVALNEQSSRHSVWITNEGNESLSITDITFSSSVFSVTETLPLTINAGESYWIYVNCTPTTLGTIDEEMVITSNSVSGQNTIRLTATPYAVNEIRLGDTSGSTGDEVTITVSLKNMNEISGLQMEIEMPDELEYVDGSFVLSDRKQDHAVTASVADGILSIVAYSPDNKAFTGTEGEIGSFKVKILGSSYVRLDIEKAMLSSTIDGTTTVDVLSGKSGCTVSVLSPNMYANTTLDFGSVSINQQNVQKSFTIRNWGTASLIISQIAFANGLFSVSEQLPITIEPSSYKDITVVCNAKGAGELGTTMEIYTNDPNKRLYIVNVSGNIFTPDYLLGEVEAKRDEVNLNISLNNYSNIYGIQFDINSAEKFSISAEDVTLTKRGKNLSVSVKSLSDGKQRVIAYCKNGKYISSGEGDVMTIKLTPAELLQDGGHSLDLSSITLGSNEMKNLYAGDDVTVTFGIGDPVVITANSYTRVYGEANPAFDYTSSGATLTGIPELTCSATSTSPVGTYDIVISKGSVTNYNDSYVNGTLTITKASLKIKAGTYTRKQGEDNPEFTLEYEGFVNGETDAVLTKKPIAETTATKESAVGEYKVKVSGAKAQNYEISYTNGTLKVTDADAVIVTANSYTRVYGEANPAFDYMSSGATLTGIPELTCSATSTSPVGTYDIVISKGSVTNYNDTYVKGTLTITKAPLKIKAGTYTKNLGEDNPEFKLEYEGFVNGETETVLTKKPTVTCKATKESAVGEYPVSVSGAEAQNYEISYVNGTLSVETILGDANGDGVVNAADIVAVIRYKKGNTPAGFAFKAADVNKDGKVDEQDVKAIEGIILKR